MKLLRVASFFVAAIAIALAPALTTICREAFPAEAARRAALDACAQADFGFDRLMAVARAQCYSRQLPASALPEIVPRRVEIAAAPMQPLF